MCESKVVLKKGKKKVVVMNDVIQVSVKGEEVEIVDILGESKSVRGSVSMIDLSGHEIVIEPK